MKVEKLKIIASPDKWNLTKNLDLTILSETIHNPFGVTLTMFIGSFTWLGAFLINNYCASW